MVGSLLSIHVIDGRDLFGVSNKTINPVLQITCGLEKAKTATVPPSIEPIWDQTFNFNIKTGTEKIKVMLYDGTSKVAGCEVEIDLYQIYDEVDANDIDQMKHDKLYTLGN